VPQRASAVADQVEARGLVCLGYPFHPAGRPETLRTEHLATLRTPTLILQGERDTLGRREEIERYVLSPSIDERYLADGDHSFKPRKASGRTESENLDEAVASVVEFIDGLG
jgi:hypothetical protein